MTFVSAAPAEPLAGLNSAQREAVLHVDGPLLVLAGAGSGKTRVLTTRIAHLVREHGVDPSRILAVTFTNKAAGEMRERLTRLLGGAPTGMWVGTFHAIGARLVRANAALVGRTAQFTIYDEDDTLAVVKRVMESARISTKDWTPKVIHRAISDAKNALVGPGEYANLANDPASRAASTVYTSLEGVMRGQNAVDFDDLLVLPVELLRTHASARELYARRFRYILVDEYQDTNRAQYALIKLLGAAGNVAVVGDDDQSIYGFRGADVRNILDFERDFAPATVVRLEENYRSTKPILDLANVVIAPNTQRLGKTLRTTRGGGARVGLVRAADERDEAQWVVDDLLTRRRADSSLLLREVVILYRTNAQSRAFEEALRRQAIPYRVVGAVRFYDRREIRDLMSYLKLIANPADDEAFRRAVAVPRRGVGDGALASLAEAAVAARVPLLAAAGRADLMAAVRPGPRTALLAFATMIADLRRRAVDAGVDELLEAVVDATRYGDFVRADNAIDAPDRLDNIRELIASAAETVVDDGGEVGLTPLDHFLQRASLVAAIDQLDPSADAVAMMTIHNAKGLEFPVVYVTGLEDGLFPLSRAYDDPRQLEEERRLLYVAVTRAERVLTLTYADHRRRNGELLPGKPSLFLASIPPAMLDRHETVRARSEGRSAFATYNDRSGATTMGASGSATRRAGVPVTRSHHGPVGFTDDAEGSQDAPAYRVGEAVRHRAFGSGTIAEVSGTGRDLKVKIDFEDAAIGRKTLVVAQAGLQRGWD